MEHCTVLVLETTCWKTPQWIEREPKKGWIKLTVQGALCFLIWVPPGNNVSLCLLQLKRARHTHPHWLPDIAERIKGIGWVFTYVVTGLLAGPQWLLPPSILVFGWFLLKTNSQPLLLVGYGGNDRVWLPWPGYLRYSSFYLAVLDQLLQEEPAATLWKYSSNPMERSVWWGTVLMPSTMSLCLLTGTRHLFRSLQPQPITWLQPQERPQNDTIHKKNGTK